jgi:Helix-turn-helix domain
VAAAVLGTTTTTLDRWVRKGKLVPHRCGREVMFPCEEINDLKRPKPIVLADTSLKAIAEALVADESEPTIQTPVPFTEDGLERQFPTALESAAMLAPRPTRTEGVFRMDRDGRLVPVRPCRPKTDEKQTDRTPVERSEVAGGQERQAQ